MTPGSMVAGRYKVISAIGSGGMGTVYQVEQVFLRRTFAIKVLNKQGDTSEKTLLRFQTEAQAASRLDHPHLIRVHDFGLLDDGSPFLVMDFADGISLQQRIKSGPLPVQEALEIFLQVCDGLAYAHDEGIIHRDLKPSNIIITKPKTEGPEVVKIVDFGIAKIVAQTEAEMQTLTQTGEIFGSPLYMSPEQCMGERVDHRSDIYSIGCSLFETLTGVTPFTGENALATMMRHQKDAPPTLKEATLGKSFPQTLETVMAKLLAKEPGRRYQNMHELKRDLKLVQEGQPIVEYKLFGPKKKSLLPYYAGLGAIVLGITLWLVHSLLAPTPPLPEFKTSPQNITDVANSLNYQLPEAQLPRETVPDKPFTDVPRSQLKPGQAWVFHFPSESIGRVREGDWKLRDAKGNLALDPAKLIYFQPSSGVCERPGWFRCFRPDDLHEIDMDWNGGVSDDTLLFINHLRTLETLCLEATEITDAGLKYLENLPLTVLSIGNTKGVTGKGLAQAKYLKHLRTLKAEFVPDVMLAIEALAGSKEMNRLQLKGDRITDADIPTICRCCPALQKLMLNRNEKITDKGVESLSALKTLELLDLNACSVTSRCAQSLAKLPRLRQLRIDTSKWTNAEKLGFARQLPRCGINAPTDEYGRIQTERGPKQW